MVAPASSAMENGISARESIYTGFLEFAQHSPADSPAYAELQQSTWITFGSLRYLVDSRGTLRPTLATLRATGAPASASTAQIGRAHV